MKVITEHISNCSCGYRMWRGNYLKFNSECFMNQMQHLYKSNIHYGISNYMLQWLGHSWLPTSHPAAYPSTSAFLGKKIWRMSKQGLWIEIRTKRSISPSLKAAGCTQSLQRGNKQWRGCCSHTLVVHLRWSFLFFSSALSQILHGLQHL